MLAAYLQRWGLVQDGEPILTPTSRLLPVRYGDQPAMLKIAVAREERDGARLMQWWGGQGVARVLAHEDDAILLERAQDWLWEAQGQQGGLIISSSKPIPLPGTAEDRDPQPPHRQAGNYYSPVAEGLDGDGFVVTMEHPNTSKPKPIIIEIGVRGL